MLRAQVVPTRLDLATRDRQRCAQLRWGGAGWGKDETGNRGEDTVLDAAMPYLPAGTDGAMDTQLVYVQPLWVADMA